MHFLEPGIEVDVANIICGRRGSITMYHAQYCTYATQGDVWNGCSDRSMSHNSKEFVYHVT